MYSRGNLEAPTTSRNRKRSKIQETTKPVEANNTPAVNAPAESDFPTPVAEHQLMQPPLIQATNNTKLARPFTFPSRVTLPPKIAIPLNEVDCNFLAFIILPTSDLKANDLFNAFCTFTLHAEDLL